MIKKWLSKKKYNNKLKKIKNDNNLLFQLIIYYNDIPKIQILRQRSLIGDSFFQNLKLDPNGLVFFLHIGEDNKSISRFKNSKYFEKSLLFDEHKVIYVFLIPGEFTNIDSVSLDLMHNILDFKKNYEVSLKLL